jgi:DNA-binding SARP family transcriptional activator
MAHLTLALFGGFDLTAAGKPIAGLKSAKVRALLAYVAIEGARSHRREMLAGLLWPDSPDAAAFNSLRNALANLRLALSDAECDQPVLLVTRETVQRNPQASLRLDVDEFARLIGEQGVPPPGRPPASDPQRIADLIAASDVYRGPLLEGFSVRSSPFEEWVLYRREEYQRQAIGVLHLLAAHYLQKGDYGAAEHFARRLLAREPYAERAHRQLMRALALDGQRAEALMQYRACTHQLEVELRVEPSTETRALYEQIRDGTLRAEPDA